MRECPTCGGANGPTDDFCGNCGSYLGWSDPAPAADPSPDPAPAPGVAPASGPAPAAPAPTPAPASGPDGPATRPVPDPPAGSPPDAPPARGTLGPPPPPSPPSPPPALPPDPPPPPPSVSGSEPPQSAPPSAPAHTDRGADAPVAPAPRSPHSAPPPARAPHPPTQEPVRPVKPAKAVAARPVVRPVATDEDVAGVPCPTCRTPNPPGRRFCRRCAATLTTTAKPAPLPWWRTLWPFRRRTRAGSGRLVRLLVILAVVLALGVAGFLLAPTARDLYEDTRDKLAEPKAVTPTSIEASAELPGHPAENSVDGLTNRYWAVPEAGATVTYTFEEAFRLVHVNIFNGASASLEDYARQGRALEIAMEITTSDGAKHHQDLTLSDKPGRQEIPTGISDTKSIRLTLTDPAGLTAGRHIAFGEVEFFRRG